MSINKQHTTKTKRPNCQFIKQPTNAQHQNSIRPTSCSCTVAAAETVTALRRSKGFIGLSKTLRLLAGWLLLVTGIAWYVENTNRFSSGYCVLKTDFFKAETIVKLR